MQNFEDVSKFFFVLKLLEGMRRSKKPCDSRLPVTGPLLHKIFNFLPQVYFNTYETKLFRAVYSLTFFGFLRVSELTLSTGNDVKSILQISDV